MLAARLIAAPDAIVSIYIPPMLRRISGVLAWSLLLNVNVERADRACATHGQEAHDRSADAHGQHASTERHADREHHLPAQGPHDHERGDEECKIPRSAECCQAAASCSITLSSDANDCSAAPHDDSRAIADPLGHELRGSPAPDTPPPKA
jgi:hypothetical protein